MKKGRVILFLVIVLLVITISCLSPALAKKSRFKDSGFIGEDFSKNKIKLPYDYDSLEDQGYISDSGEIRVIVVLDVEKLDAPVIQEKTRKESRIIKRFVDEEEFSDARSKVLEFVNNRKKQSGRGGAVQTEKGSPREKIVPKKDFPVPPEEEGEEEIIDTSKSRTSLNIKLLKLIRLLLGVNLPEEWLEKIPDRVLEEFESGSGSRGSINTKDLRIIGSVAVELPYDSIEELATLEHVKEIHLDKLNHILLNESLSQINTSGAWNISDANGTNVTGAGMRIAILDTGVDYTHADLGNCTSEEFLNGSCAKVIGGYDTYNNDSNPMDDHGHGTHCAATAGGNGTLNGVAPDAQILAYKVLSSTGSGYDSDIIEGIERAVNDNADVISMSLGSDDCDPYDALSLAVDAAVAQGVVSVIAAGNSGPSARTVGSPGCARTALTVAAACKTSQVDNHSYCINSNISSFSSRGPAQIFGKPDISAPGVLICAAQHDTYQSDSECIDTDHIAISGTSMATPHVAGAVALIKQMHPLWNPHQIKAAIEYTADDLGEPRLSQGAGLINVGEAVALNSSPPVAYIENVSDVIYVDY